MREGRGVEKRGTACISYPTSLPSSSERGKGVGVSLYIPRSGGKG